MKTTHDDWFSLLETVLHMAAQASYNWSSYYTIILNSQKSNCITPL